jgi:Zn-dependent protease
MSERAGRSPFASAITLFDIAGFKIRLDLSWVILALLVSWSLAQGFFPALYEGLPPSAYWWMGLAAVLGLAVSIVLHELAHSVVARRHGLPIRSITLFALGGVAEMGAEPPSARVELLMAIAGPIASVVLAVIFYFGSGAAESIGAPEAFVAVLSYLALVNGVLAAFNLVPAFPLDGGRVLRAALWSRWGDLQRATQVAARFGTFAAYVLIALGVLNAFDGNLVSGLWWVVLGLFLKSAATSERYQLLTRLALQGKPVSRFMTRDPIVVPAEISVQTLLDEYVYGHYHELFPVVEDGRLLGGVGVREIKGVPREARADTLVRAVLTPCSADTSVAPDEDAAQTLAHMSHTGNTRLLVQQNGQLAGIVTIKDLLRALAVRADLEK